MNCAKAMLRVAATLALLPPCSAVYGAVVHGTVKNGTTGKPGADVEVILIQLQGGMQPVANAKTDAQGNFTFDNPSIGVQPMLVRAVYRGVNFHQPLPPGRNEVEVEVFEPSRDPKTINVGTHFVVFQPNGSSLIVGEEYGIANNSQPAQAYFRADGSFDFALPAGASLKQVAAQGPSGMPVVQAPLDRGKDRYSIAYAFRPGENSVRLSYELPYDGSAATVKLPTVHPESRLVLVAAPSVKVTGDGLQPGGVEQGMNVYSREGLAANSAFNVSVSGTAPPPQADAGDAGPQNRDDQQGSGPSGVTVQTIPGRMDDLKWPLVGGFVVVFALLAVMLARRPVLAVATAGAETDGKKLSASPKVAAKAVAARAAAATPSAVPASGAAMSEVDAAISTGLDALKDTLFKLELRRQAGTISEEDYARERARAEKILRELVRG